MPSPPCRPMGLFSGPDNDKEGSQMEGLGFRFMPHKLLNSPRFYFLCHLIPHSCNIPRPNMLGIGSIQNPYSLPARRRFRTPSHGSFPTQEDPYMEPNILSFLLWGPPNMAKSLNPYSTDL